MSASQLLECLELADRLLRDPMLQARARGADRATRAALLANREEVAAELGRLRNARLADVDAALAGHADQLRAATEGLKEVRGRLDDIAKVLAAVEKVVGVAGQVVAGLVSLI